MKTSYSKSPKYRTRAVTQLQNKKSLVEVVVEKNNSLKNVLDPLSIIPVTFEESSKNDVCTYMKKETHKHNVPKDTKVSSNKKQKECEGMEYCMDNVPPDCTEDLNMEDIKHNSTIHVAGTDLMTSHVKHNPTIDITGTDSTDNEEEHNLGIISTNYKHPLFLQEPFHIEFLEADEESVEKLNGEFALSTSLIDFLIKNGTPIWKTEEFLVPTCNIEKLLDYYNKKAASTDSKDQEFVEKKRKNFQFFSSKVFQVVTLTCQKDHYFVVSMTFDANDVDGDFFGNIIIYDSLKRSSRNEEKVVKKVVHNEAALQLLRKYQLFFLNYILYNSKHRKLLDEDSGYILRCISYGQTPQQKNGYDCGLFAFGILLHLIYGIKIKENIFCQKTIDYFRQALYIVLNAPANVIGDNVDPKKFIAADFLASFFDKTFRLNDKPNIFLNYLRKHNVGYISPTKNKGNEENNQDYKVEEIILDTLDPIEPFFDTDFHDHFIESPQPILSLDDLSKKITYYEECADIKLKVSKSDTKIGSRLYTCISHLNCCFRARFGPRRGNKNIVLKAGYNINHEGLERNGVYMDGRKFKQSITKSIGPIIDQVKMVKSSKPVAKDLVKASRSLHGKKPSYGQAHKVINGNEIREKIEAKKNYQFIIPYLEEFQKKNPGTVIDYERNKEKALLKIFICPGIMNNKLKYVRPVISLDAAHLSSVEKGTLYLATIKSGNNEILPIAIAMTADNENYKGWKFFLKNLKLGCGNITLRHKQLKVHPYKLFTYISDRDKGLIPALRETFPENHHTNCLFHIRQNVIKNYGVKCGDIVEKIGNTFSIGEEEVLLEDLRKLNKNAEQYVLKINPETWRCSQWFRNGSLPPRYGVLYSNNSESSNAMFKEARTCSWLIALDKMLHIIQVKIANHREEYNKIGKTGMLPIYKSEYKKLFDKSVTFDVVLIDEERETYKVYHGEGETYNHSKSHIVDIEHEYCTCGKWQDTELMCEHAMAVCREIYDFNVSKLYDEPIPLYYTYQTLGKFYKENINPVIIHLLQSDGETKPPPINNKRQPGRPSNKRRRTRSKTDKTVVCGKCGRKGHNQVSCNFTTKKGSENNLEAKSEESTSQCNINTSLIPATANSTLNYESDINKNYDSKINKKTKIKQSPQTVIGYATIPNIGEPTNDDTNDDTNVFATTFDNYIKPTFATAAAKRYNVDYDSENDKKPKSKKSRKTAYKNVYERSEKSFY